LKAKGITPAKVQDPDPRSGFEVVLDWIDLPRNLVAQAVGKVGGVDFSKVKERGTFGLKRVTMSQVLGKLGMKPGIGRAVAGFLGDVAIDPLTYLMSGATIGKQLAKHLPRMTPAFVKQLRNVAKGRTASAGLTKAIGAKNLANLQRLARHGGKGITAKQAQKRLFNRSGGTLTKLLERGHILEKGRGPATRAVLEKGLFPGQQLFGVPFTGIAGPTIPGKTARAFKALGKGEEFAKLARGLQKPKQGLRLLATISKLRREAKAAEAGGDALKASGLRAQANKLRRQVRELGQIADPLSKEAGEFVPKHMKPSPELLGQLAKGEIGLQRYGGDAPELLKLRNLALQGKSPTTKIGQAVTDLFGPKYTPARAQELAITNMRTQGVRDSAARSMVKMAPEFDPVIANLRKAGLLPDDLQQSHRIISDILEVKGAEGLKMSALEGLNPNDPLRALFRTEAYQKVLNHPDVAKLVAINNQFNTDDLARKTTAGVRATEATGPVSGLNRVASRESRPFLAAQAGRVGSFAGGQHRVRVVEFLQDGQPVLLSENSIGKIEGLQNTAGVFSKVDVSFGGKVIEGKSAVLMNAAQIAVEQKAGNQVTLSAWDASSQMIEKMLQSDSGLRTRLGYDSKQANLRYFFDPDPVAAIASRAAEQANAVSAGSLKKLAQSSGHLVTSADLSRKEWLGMRLPTELAKDHPLIGLIGPGVFPIKGGKGVAQGGQGLAFQAPVADALDRMAKLWEGGKSYNALLQASDMTLNWFKRWALFHPAYVIRNVWDNTFGIIVAGGNPVRAARHAMSKSVRRIRKAIISDDIASLGGKTLNIGGKAVPEQEIARFSQQHNMLAAGRTAADIVPFARAAGRSGQVAGKVVQKGKGFINGVRTANSAVEESMRLGAFLSFLDDGMDSGQALMKTVLSMPDLSNVTKFEKSFLTRIFPWYRWAKNNGARQFLHMIPQKPAYIAGVRKFQNLIQGMAPTVPDNLRPEWMREAQAAQISGDEESGSAFMLRNWFPYEEAQALTAGLASPQEAARYIAGSTRPGIKLPFELATGSDIFRQRPSEAQTLAQSLRDAPGALVGASGTPLDNFLAIRPLREFRRVGEQPDMLGKGLRTFLGGAVQPLSAERGRQEINLKTRNALQKLRQKIIRARENRDEVEVQSLLRQFMQQQVKRQRTGLKIPRAVQEALAAAGGQ